MKKTNRYLSFLLLLLLIGVTSSCIKDDYTPESKEKANVSVKLNTRANDDNFLTNEGIKTVRLILVQEGQVIINHLFSVNTDSEEETFSILGIPAQNTDFYAVVNEASVNQNFDSYTTGSRFDASAFKGTLLSANFPATYSDIANSGLPTAGELLQQYISDGFSVTIPVTRAIARIDLNITNNSGADLPITSVDFGAFFTNQTPLFSQENLGSTSYSSHSFEETETINKGGDHTFTYYLYESRAGNNAYTVGLNNGQYKPIAIKKTENNQPIDELLRNQILRINATVNESEIEVNNLQVVIAPWEENNVTVPPFE